ncbi:MAG: hypothetical protein J6M34_03070 [Clostridia bacterium]|nr:hypothetical protein [Clostridia bacterium]
MMRRIAIIILSILLVGTVCLLLSDQNEDKQTEVSTLEKTATVKYITEKVSENKNYLYIYTQEFDAPLYVFPHVFETLKSEDLSCLSEGTKIQFRISPDSEALLKTGPFLSILALRTDSCTIFSLDDYNAAMHPVWSEIRTVEIVFCFVFILGILCLLYFDRKKKINLKKELNH